MHNILSIILICFGLSLLNAQADTLQYNTQKQFSFRTLTNNDGLSQNSVISIQQDSIGYLWLATQNGLNKYDGRSFKYYDKQFEDITRATYSKLGKIYIDNQNRVWIITHSGKLELYQPENDSFYPIKSLDNSHSIYQDNSLNLFVGLYKKGLLKINSKTKDTLIVCEKLLKNQTINDFLELDNSILLAASGAVYEVSDSKTCRMFDIEATEITNFSSFEKSEDGTIWLGSYGSGLFFKSTENQSFKRFQHPELPIDLNIEDLLIDKKKRLWIATYGDGVFLVDNATNNVYNFKANKNNPFAIHYNDILCLYEDNTGVIWFGSDGTGASYYDEHLIKFNILTNNQVPKDVNVDMVRSLAKINTDIIYIGTSGKGLTVYNSKTDESKTLTTKNSNLNSNRIISLNAYKDELWVGHQGYGLNSINASGVYKSYPEISSYTIWSILEETKNRRWLCTERHGLILFDTKEGIIKAYNTKNSALNSNNIRIVVPGNRALWIGTDDTGVYKLDLNSDTIIKIGKLDFKIKSLSFQNDILWVGTNGDGLKKYNTRSNTIISGFTLKDGLPDDVIYGILEDAEGNLWLSTNNGISTFNPSQKNPQFENFNMYDGLQGREFNTGAFLKDKSGTLFFGGLEGINWFDPQSLSYNTSKPKTIISDFKVFSKKRAMSDGLVLKHNSNTVTFTFSSLHFSQPERSSYKYQLVNHDQNWIDGGNSNTAHYTNLPPNRYSFKVISSNYDGVWNENPAIFNFSIKKPWYKSNVAMISYCFLLMLLIFSIYFYLKWRWHMKMQLQFEHAETERLKKLDKLKTKLYTNLSHEFRTPLTLIKGPIENQLSNPRLSKNDKEELHLVKINSNRLLNLVDQLLDLSKLESGNYNLGVSSGDLDTLLKQIAVAFKYKASEKNIRYNYKIQPITNAFFDKDIIEKVVGNLLSNAIKYTPAKGDVNFTTKVHHGQIIINVVNTCENLNEIEVGKLFQRYYQKNNNIDGVGIGLNLVKELCILSHGNVVVHALNDKKIQFTVTLPIERPFFNSDEIAEETLHNQRELTKSNIKNNNSKIVKNSGSKNDKPILLVVEDDRDILSYIKSIFKDQYKIKTASNGSKGIESAIKTIPDIIISDIMMPKTNGLQLCNHLKSDERTSHIPIILLTAKSGENNEIMGLEAGADDYIVKPFSNKKLKLKVEKLIESRQNLQEKYSKTFELNAIVNNKSEHNFLERLKNVLDKNIIDSDFNAKRLSDAMLMSRMQLHRKLKNLTGLTTTEFIRNERLKLAKKLLKQNKATVSEIAYQVGFNTPSYFIKSFKKVYHSTPSEFLSK